MKTDQRTKHDADSNSASSKTWQPAVIAVSHHLPLKIAKERVRLLLEYFRRDPQSGKLKSSAAVKWQGDMATTELRLGLDFLAPCRVWVEGNRIRWALPKETPGQAKDRISADLSAMLECSEKVPAGAALWRCHHDRAAQTLAKH